MQKMKKLAGGLLALLLCAAMLAAPVSGWFAAPVTAAMEVPARNSAAPVAQEADAANLTQIGGTSRMEMDEGKLGLAFRFSLDCTGVTIGDNHVGDYTNGKVTVDGTEYDLVSVGALMANDPFVGGDTSAFKRENAGANGSKVIDINAKYLYNVYHKDYVNYTADGIVYAVRITNIPESFKDTDIYARAYFVYKNGDKEVTAYDDVYVADYAKTDDISYTTPVVNFEKKFNKDFLYRVGNDGAVSLGTLFAADAGVNSANVGVTVETVDNTGATGTYTAGSSWDNGSIDFNGTGVVKVSITNKNYSAATSVLLEVVNAKNATGAASATANNVVLLKDAGFGALEVKNGYTLYGNGFTLTCGSDSVALDMGYGFLTLDNGTLDNVQVVCPNFDYPIMFKKNYSGSYSETDSKGTTRYGNIRSAVIASGNSRIVNSRISGGRAAVYATNGNIVIEGSRIELGAAANVHVNPSVAQMTFKDVTLVQRPTQANVHSDKTVMGFSVVATTTEAGEAAPITLEGEFKQYTWAYEDYLDYAPSSGQTYVVDILDKTNYIHSIQYEDGTTHTPSVNMGIVYFPDDGSANEPTNLVDNQTTAVYDKVSITKMSHTVWIYSIKNSGSIEGLHMADLTPYEPFAQGNMLPTLEYSDTNDDRVMSAFYDADKGWVYKLSVNLDNGDYTFDTSKLLMLQSGAQVDYTWPAGTASTINVAEGTAEYALSATINGEAHTVYFQLIGTATTIEAPQWSSDAAGSALSATMNASWEAGLCVASSRGGTWSGAAPALQNVYVRYYSTVAKAYKVINLADYTPTTTGKLNGTNTTYTINGEDFTLTLTGGQVHSSNKVNAMPVSVSVDGKNKLFFVASSSNGLVNSGNSARAVPVTYSFTDNLGNTLAGSHSWSVAEDQDNEYKYSDFCNGTLTKLEASGGGSGCVTPDTLITLADGSQVRVDSLTGDEMLLVWNMETGKYDIAPIVFVDSEEEAEYEIVHLYFSDGSDVKVVYEHGFFDLDLGEYVYIDADNYADYVGHRFVTEGDVAANQWNVVTLDDVVIEREVTTAWSPVTFGHLCYYTNGVLSMPGGISGLFNIFEVDTNTMTYDAEAMQKDIETYGLLTLEDFGGLITQDAFDAFNGAYLQIAIGKGNLTWEDIAYMAERYIPLM